MQRISHVKHVWHHHEISVWCIITSVDHNLSFQIWKHETEPLSWAWQPRTRERTSQAQNGAPTATRLTPAPAKTSLSKNAKTVFTLPRLPSGIGSTGERRDISTATGIELTGWLLTFFVSSFCCYKEKPVRSLRFLLKSIGWKMVTLGLGPKYVGVGVELKHLDQEKAIYSHTLPLESIKDRQYLISGWDKLHVSSVHQRQCLKSFWDINQSEECCVMGQSISWGKGYNNRDMKELCICVFVILWFCICVIDQGASVGGDREWQPWH